ncbi:ABC transporter permease [Anaerolentibacter hominis]|uniref:ABC transporter permease n=1 Tax=Anaerolentibacter hominis TaxID=3079009 RepID=UPI0031B8A54E
MENKTAKGRFSTFTKKYGIVIIFVVLVIAASILQPKFLQPKNLTNVLRQVAVNGILAIGMTFVIISGAIDLSVGSLFCVCGMVMMYIMPTVGWVGAIAVGLLIGAVVGIFNGYFIYRGMPAFIMTLAVSIILRGVAFMTSNGAPLASSSKTYNAIGQEYLFGIPIQVYLYLIMAGLAAFIMAKTKFGRSVYAIGGNMEVARLSGISVKKIQILVYIISGMLAAVAAVIGTARLGSCEPALGEDYHSDAIAATVIGGTLMSGGEGSQVKTVVGVLLLGVLSNILNLIGVSPYLQYVFKGGIIIFAVAADVMRRKQ